MRERERLEDFRGGHVACRGCKRLILFQPGELLQVACCGHLYVPEYGPMDLVIYDRLQPGEDRYAQVMPTPEPMLILPTEEETRWYAGEPEPTEPTDPEEGDPQEEEQELAPEEDDAEVTAMLASEQEIQARRGEREQQLRRRGPKYD